MRSPRATRAPRVSCWSSSLLAQTRTRSTELGRVPAPRMCSGIWVLTPLVMSGVTPVGRIWRITRRGSDEGLFRTVDRVRARHDAGRVERGCRDSWDGGVGVRPDRGQDRHGMGGAVRYPAHLAGDAYASGCYA